MVILKEDFINRIKTILSEKQFEEYMNSFNSKAYHGINFNKKKLNDKYLKECLNSYNLTYLKDLLYEYEESDTIRPGKSIYFQQGLFYIQEPSQMNVVEHLDIQKSDKVLDLCASPGGKSAQVLNYLSEDDGGFLLANEYDSKRAKILSSNIERLGYANVFVTNMTVNDLQDNFCEYFDKIIVDAPCSGEGMFRKDENAINEWSLQNVERCVNRQKEIIESAYNMLKHNGYLGYSTCTFEREENEEIIKYIMSKHSNLEKIDEGRAYPFTKESDIIAGEGHYFCILRKN